MIPLDKNPGLRPVGVMKAVGSLQISEGQDAGAETVANAVETYFLMLIQMQFS